MNALTIFFVEDSVPVLDRYRDMIEEIDGAELLGVADNETEALSGIHASSPNLVVLDLNLKDGNGFEVLRKIKLSTPSTTVAVVTNFSHPQIKSRCLTLGADYFFDKTSGNKGFVELIGKLARQSPS
jgi:DNA-binding NarL/FixJ family response regulator